MHVRAITMMASFIPKRQAVANFADKVTRVCQDGCTGVSTDINALVTTSRTARSTDACGLPDRRAAQLQGVARQCTC